MGAWHSRSDAEAALSYLELHCPQPSFRVRMEEAVFPHGSGNLEIFPASASSWVILALIPLYCGGKTKPQSILSYKYGFQHKTPCVISYICLHSIGVTSSTLNA